MANAQKPDFFLSAKRTSPFKLAGASVQSTTGSRGVRISGSNGSNVGYTMFQRWCEGYWLPSPFGSFPFTSPPVRHRVSSHFNWTVRGRWFMRTDTVRYVETSSDVTAGNWAYVDVALLLKMTHITSF